MVYKYEEERSRIFTDNGVVTLLEIRDNVDELLEKAGAFKLWNGVKGYGSSSFLQLAIIDYLVEIKHIKEIPTTGSSQDRIFISTKTD